MIDLTASTDSGTGTLSAFTAKRDGRASNALQFGVRLVFSVEDEPAADKIDHLLRGARAYFEANRDTEDVGGINIKPGDIAGNVKLIENETGTVLIDAVAEVRKVEMRKAAKSFQYLVDLTLNGLTAAAASHLATMLDERITVAWDANNAQQALPFHAPQTSNAVQIVTVEHGSGYRFGIQTGLDGDRILIDDFGQTYEAKLDDVISKVIVGPDDASKTMLDIAAPYKAKMEAAGAAASWQFVILALADRNGGAAPSGAHKVGVDVMERAVEKARASVAN